MKKKWIAAGTAAGVVLLGAVVVFAVKQSSQERVKVVSMQEMSGWGGMYDMSMSGNITSDVSQDIYLGSNQVVDQIFVQEGDTVYLGDPLVSYDMTLVNLELEMKKLDKEGIQLNIKKAQREITKLKNTKPASDDGGFDDPGFFDDPGMIEDPGDVEEPEDEPAAAYEELDGDSEPYMGEGTVEDPYHFLCSQNGVVLGSFLNKMAQSQCFFLIEVRAGDVSNGELLKVWGQKIADKNMNLDPNARFEMELNEFEDVTVTNTKVFDELTGSNVDEYCKGDGSSEKPYTYLISADGVVKGSFFNQMKEKNVHFRLEVWRDNVYGGTLLKAWEQDGGLLDGIVDDDEYVVGLGKKEPGADDEDEKDTEENPDPTPGGEQKPGEEQKPENKPGGEQKPEDNLGNEQKPEDNPGNEQKPEDNTDTIQTPENNSNNGQEAETGTGMTSSQDSTVEENQTVPENSRGEYPAQQEAGIVNPMTSSAVYTRIIPLDAPKTVDNVMDDSMGGGMSKEEIQKQIKEKETEIRDYQLDLKEADLELKKIEKTLKNQTVRSTLNGVVKTVEDPDQAGANGKPLIQVVSSEGLYIKGSIGEMQLEKLQVGDKLNGYSYDTGVSFTAEVREISPYPLEGEQGTNSSYPFTAYIENAEGLKNYSYAELTPMGEDGTGGSNKVTVQKPFVRTEDGQYYVMIDDGEGRLKKQVIQISRIIWGSTYEISEGLNWDDKIAFPYGKNVVEGAKTEDGTMEDLYR